MARKLIVEVVSDVKQYLRGISDANAATATLDVQVNELNVDTRKLAETQVAAAARGRARLQEQVVAYRQISAAAIQGSHEQVAAANLAARAERQLAGSIATVGHESNVAARGANHLGREVDRAARGALSGSGLFHSFGRSLAFASGGFIAFHEASEFIRDSINAAREAVVAHRSLAAQMKASGESFAANREEIERVAVSYGRFGFQNDEVIESLTVLERGTGKISQALKLQGLTADIARAKSIGLAQAAQVVAKVFGGQETALRRAVPGLEKNAHGWELIREAQRKVAGQAAANTTAAERFQATLHDTEEIVGGALLPTLNRYLDSLGKWLQKMNESGELEHDVAETADVLASAFDAVTEVLRPLVKGFQALSTITGSTKNSVKLLLEALLAYKGLKLLSSLGAVSSEVAAIGANAEKSTGKVGTLRGSLGKLASVGTIPVVISLMILESPQYKKFREESKSHLGPFDRIFQNLPEALLAGPKAGLYSAKGIASWFGIGADERSSEGAVNMLLDGVKKTAAKVAKKVDLRAQGIQIPANVKPPTVQQRNTWFDALVGRSLGRVQDLDLSSQVGALQKIAGQIEKRMAVTKDITRKLNLEDKLLDVRRQIKATQEQIFDSSISRVLSRVGDLPIGQQIGQLQSIGAQIAERIRATKDVDRKLELEDQLYDVMQQQKEAREQQAQAANDLFDSQISRVLSRVGDLPIARQLPRLQTVAAQIAARIAATRDVQRKLELEDQLYDVMQQQKQVRAAKAQGAEDLFDSTVSRVLSRLDALSLDQQLAALHKLDAQLEARIAVTKSIIRKRQLEDELWDNAQREQAIKAQKEQRTLDWLQFHLDEARTTKTLNDDIKVERRIIAEIQRQIKLHGRTLALARLLLQARTDLKDTLAEKRKSGSSSGSSSSGDTSFTPASVPPPRTVPVGTRPFSGQGAGTMAIQNLNLYGVQNVPQLEDELLKRAGTRPQPRRGT